MKNSPWEEVARGKDQGKDEGDEWGTCRWKVPGGWFITHWVWSKDTGNTTPSTFFYPEPNHEWDGQ